MDSLLCEMHARASAVSTLDTASEVLPGLGTCQIGANELWADISGSFRIGGDDSVYMVPQQNPQTRRVSAMSEPFLDGAHRRSSFEHTLCLPAISAGEALAGCSEALVRLRQGCSADMDGPALDMLGKPGAGAVVRHSNAPLSATAGAFGGPLRLLDIAAQAGDAQPPVVRVNRRDTNSRTRRGVGEAPSSAPLATADQTAPGDSIRSGQALGAAVNAAEAGGQPVGTDPAATVVAAAAAMDAVEPQVHGPRRSRRRHANDRGCRLSGGNGRGSGGGGGGDSSNRCRGSGAVAHSPLPCANDAAGVGIGSVSACAHSAGRPALPPAATTAGAAAGPDASQVTEAAGVALTGAGAGALGLRTDPRVVIMPSVASLLEDVTELSSLSPRGAPSGMWLGTWRGRRVAIKLRASSAWPADDPALTAAAAASRLAHPHLLPVHAIRVTRVDDAALAELVRVSGKPPPPRPSPRCNSGGGGGWAPVARLGARPMGRFPGAFAAGPAPAPAGAPADPRHRQPPASPALQALSSLRLARGGAVVAVLSEYCELGNLHALSAGPDSPFRASPAWPLHVAQRALLRTARELAAALAALHAAGITHGALRPSNVLLARPASAPTPASSASTPAATHAHTPLPTPTSAPTPTRDGTSSSSSSPLLRCDGRGFRAQLVDVGAASLATAASNPLAAGPCMVLLSPEALTDSVAMRAPPADVYAYGMLLYVMAAGRMPFAGQHLVPVLMAVASDGLQPELPTGQHDHLEPLFRACIARSPADRPTAEQVLTQIVALEQQVKEAKRARKLRPSSVLASVDGNGGTV